jgi:BlaI family transcriptional regulator, penicillinase repressor
MAPTPDILPRREREILNVIFAADRPVSADEVRAGLTNPPSYSAVRAMLAKLEAKGYVRHREEGLRYLYAPTTPRTSARKTALQQLVKVFFRGSVGEAATALLKQEDWTVEELDALSAEIARVRDERNRS